MPRKRPAELRAARARPGFRFRPVPPVHIPGLRLGTCLAIRRVELADGRTPLIPGVVLWPGATARALHRFRGFLASPPGRRPRYPEYAECSCPGCCVADDVTCARDILAEVLLRLPPAARSDLGRTVRALDEEFLRRTLPDPFARSGWNGHLWWHRRLRGERRPR